MDPRELTDLAMAVSHRYAREFGIERDEDRYLLKLHEEVGELTQALMMASGRARKKGLEPARLREAVRAELADVLCQTLLLARCHGVDIQDAVADKWLARS